MQRVPTPRPKDVAAVAARGLWSAALQLASAICRHYWPVALLAALLFRSLPPRRRWWPPLSTGWWTGPAGRQSADEDAQPIGLLTYLVLKRLDDIAYGLGLWYGVLRERNVGPLKPQIRLTPDRSCAAQRCADHRCGQRWICCCRTGFQLIPAVPVAVLEAGPGPARSGVARRDRQRTAVADRRGQPAGAAVSDPLTDRPAREMAIMRGARRSAGPAPSTADTSAGVCPRLRRLGVARLGLVRRLPNTSAQSRPTWISAGRRTVTRGPILVRRTHEFDR